MSRDYVAAASDLPAEQQAALCKAWDKTTKIAAICALNLASITLFLEHAAQLDGIVTDCGENSRWQHLPYWIYSHYHWLPLRSTETRLWKDKCGCPMFFGTAYGLLDNLAEIAALSPAGLGAVPPHFELMQTDLKAFYELSLEPFDDETTLQWIWRACSKEQTSPLRTMCRWWSA